MSYNGTGSDGFRSVEATLDRLADRARLVLVIRGDLLQQEAKLAASGLGDRFAGVEIVSDKTPDTFRRLFARHGVAPERAVMAGDSMRSDVLPALAAGAWAALIPQPLGWAHEAAPAPVGEPRFVQFGRLAELPDWIEELRSRKQKAPLIPDTRSPLLPYPSVRRNRSSK